MPAGKFAHGAVFEVGQLCLFEGGVDRLPVGTAGAVEPADGAGAPAHDGVFDGDGEVPLEEVLLGYVADVGAGFEGRFPENIDAPFTGGYKPEQGAQQGGFACAVCPDEPDEFAGAQG